MQKMLLLFISFLGTFSLIGQGLDDVWNKVYPRPAQENVSEEKIHDIIVLTNGDLALVGEVKYGGRKGQTDGLFMIVDATTGKIKNDIRKNYGNTNNQSLYAITEAEDDGTLYLVGYTADKSDDKDAWLLQITAEGDILKNEKFEDKGDSQFEKVVWLDDRSILIAGTREAAKGSLWLKHIQQEKATDIPSQVGGIVGDIKGMIKQSNGRIWLCGNAPKGKKNVWIGEISQNKDDFIVRTESLNDDGKDLGEVVYAANKNPYDCLLLTGGTNANGSGASDAWLVEIESFDAYKNKRQKIFDDYWITENRDFATTVFQSLNQPKWMTVRHFLGSSDVSSRHKMLFWGKDKQDFDLNNYVNHSFRGVKIVKTQQKNYVIAGYEKGRRKDPTVLRLVCLKNGAGMTAKSKGSLKLEVEQDPVLNTKNGDDVLSAGETGDFKIILKNTGQVDVMEGSAYIEADGLGGLTEGVVFPQPMMMFNEIPINGQKTIFVKVKGTNDLKTGRSNVNIYITANGQDALTIPAEIKSGAQNQKGLASPPPSNLKPTVDFYTQERGEQTVFEEEYTIKGAIFNPSNEDIKNKPRSLLNGTKILVDNEKKNTDFELEERGDAANMQQFYRFSYTIKKLNKGLNELHIRLDNEIIGTLKVNYSDRKPNLHLITIGPSFEDLDFTAHDANDFADFVDLQRNNDYYNQVNIKRLVLKGNTTTGIIEKAFIKKLAEFNNNKIKSNDHLMVFFSGHGKEEDNNLYLLTSEYEEGDSGEVVKKTSIDYQRIIKEYLNPIKCKKIIFLDACGSANATGGKDIDYFGNVADAITQANNIAAGTITFSSSSPPNEPSYEDKKWKNGAFTEALLEGASGKTITLLDIHSGQISLSANGLYLSPNNEKAKIIEKTTSHHRLIWESRNNHLITMTDGSQWKIEQGEMDDYITAGELYTYLRIRVPDLVSQIQNAEKQQRPYLPLTDDIISTSLPLFKIKR